MSYIQDLGIAVNMKSHKALKSTVIQRNHLFNTSGAAQQDNAVRQSMQYTSEANAGRILSAEGKYPQYGAKHQEAMAGIVGIKSVFTGGIGRSLNYDAASG